MEVKRHLWAVVYDTTFESSSGMHRYSIPQQQTEGLVVTATADLAAVEREIQATLDNQSQVTRIRSALWLGQLINGA